MDQGAARVERVGGWEGGGEEEEDEEVGERGSIPHNAVFGGIDLLGVLTLVMYVDCQGLSFRECEMYRL